MSTFKMSETANPNKVYTDILERLANDPALTKDKLRCQPNPENPMYVMVYNVLKAIVRKDLDAFVNCIDECDNVVRLDYPTVSCLLRIKHRYFSNDEDEDENAKP